MCDAVAVLILWRAGVDGAALPRALEKIARYNDGRLGRAMNAAAIRHFGNAGNSCAHSPLR